MNYVIQRVDGAEVRADGKTVGECGRGLLVLVCAVKGDTAETAGRVAAKITAMRIFEDENGKLGKSVKDISGEILVVSNFTLCGSCRRGNRPDFSAAERSEPAEKLCEQLINELRNSGVKTASGEFGAEMKIKCGLCGPVTVILDSEKDFPAKYASE